MYHLKVLNFRAKNDKNIIQIFGVKIHLDKNVVLPQCVNVTNDAKLQPAAAQREEQLSQTLFYNFFWMWQNHIWSRSKLNFSVSGFAVSFSGIDQNSILRPPSSLFLQLLDELLRKQYVAFRIQDASMAFPFGGFYV